MHMCERTFYSWAAINDFFSESQQIFSYYSCGAPDPFPQVGTRGHPSPMEEEAGTRVAETESEGFTEVRHRRKVSPQRALARNVLTIAPSNNMYCNLKKEINEFDLPRDNLYEEDPADNSLGCSTSKEDNQEGYTTSKEDGFTTSNEDNQDSESSFLGPTPPVCLPSLPQQKSKLKGKQPSGMPWKSPLKSRILSKEVGGKKRRSKEKKRSGPSPQRGKPSIMKITSLNVRGLSDPSRVAILGQWFKDKCLNPDFICLQEIKIYAEDLQKRLKRISSNHLWLSTSHPRGAGGAAIGISHS
ncbi:hypothetical protein KP509_31G033700 [Ceratopteris richardii]|uniref:Uncharacterized protein n=1 Tax=Ceratopteris richardii TaxID=49495 RepID=A0A8T2QYA2_CERRI|nr:hypothetical protein KP509_31G033700 [Ceratopteris richardii]